MTINIRRWKCLTFFWVKITERAKYNYYATLRAHAIRGQHLPACQILFESCVMLEFRHSFSFLLLVVGAVRCSRGDYASSCSYVWDYTIRTSGGLCIITFAKCPQISSLHIHKAWWWNSSLVCLYGDVFFRCWGRKIGTWSKVGHNHLWREKKSALIIWTNNRHCLSDTNLTSRFQRDNCHVMYEYNGKYRVIR